MQTANKDMSSNSLMLEIPHLYCMLRNVPVVCSAVVLETHHIDRTFHLQSMLLLNTVGTMYDMHKAGTRSGNAKHAVCTSLAEGCFSRHRLLHVVSVVDMLVRHQLYSDQTMQDARTSSHPSIKLILLLIHRPTFLQRFLKKGSNKVQKQRFQKTNFQPPQKKGTKKTKVQNKKGDENNKRIKQQTLKKKQEFKKTTVQKQQRFDKKTKVQKFFFVKKNSEKSNKQVAKNTKKTKKNKKGPQSQFMLSGQDVTQSLQLFSTPDVKIFDLCICVFPYLWSILDSLLVIVFS